MGLRRMVAARALTRECVLVNVVAARVRLKAMTAQMSQAAFAVNFPEGMCARADAFRSALTFLMIVWRRWT